MISSAMEVLGKDGVVAFPTDTLYGIATRITSVKGYRRIYDIKGREQSKPVAICFASFEQLVRWMPHLTGYPVINALLPGPVTIVLPRTDEIPPHVNPLWSDVHGELIDIVDCRKQRQLVVNMDCEFG